MSIVLELLGEHNLLGVELSGKYAIRTVPSEPAVIIRSPSD